MSRVNPCGAFTTENNDPHTAAYCNLVENHSGPHYSVLKNKVWVDEDEERDESRTGNL